MSNNTTKVNSNNPNGDDQEFKTLFSEDRIEWAGIVNEALWWCAGVNKKILRQCPTDYAKYAGIGGTILFTALMAMLSGGYALNSVFDRPVVAVLFGIFWGMLIFNLDRFIVNTMYSDGKHTISWPEFQSGLPRIIMAIFLGIVISTPLELKIFEDAIDIRIEQDKDELVNQKISSTVHERDSIAQKRDDIMNGVTMFDAQITTSSTVNNGLLTEISGMQTKLQKLNSDINSLSSQIAGEKAALNKKGLSSSQRLHSLNAKRAGLVRERNSVSAAIRNKQGELAASDSNLKSLMDNKQTETNKESARLQSTVDSLNRVINEANSRHKDWSKKMIKEKGSFRDKLDVEYKGFQAKMNAFSELKDESFSTWISSLFIMLLFIIIETAPTFFKMMMEDGPYDDLLRAEKHRVKILSDKQISDINDVVNTRVQISTQENRDKLDAEIKANKEVISKIALVQAELLQTAIEEWRQEELQKIHDNPGNYIKSDNS